MNAFPGPRAVFALAALIAAVARAGPPDDLVTERGRVLRMTGEVKDLTGQRVVLGPLEDGVGLVFVRLHREAEAKAMRFHFTVENEGTAPSWALQVKDAARHEVWSASPADALGPAFWSDEVAGDVARIEVYSTTRANPVVIAIDRVAIRNEKSKPLSITGNHNDLKKIRGQDPWIVDRGRSVARLRFVADKGGAFSCTAFLVAPDLLLTNQHCIATETERDSALVDFDYDTDPLKQKPLRVKELVVRPSFPLDYSLLRLPKPTDRRPLKLDSTHAADGAHLVVIQHPGGEPKQVSIHDCVVAGASVQGRQDPDTDFGHQCDTLTGSSGSPVIRLDTQTVVGLHHLAYDDRTLFNRAVHVDRILCDLPVGVRAEIEGGVAVSCPAPSPAPSPSPASSPAPEPSPSPAPSPAPSPPG